MGAQATAGAIFLARTGSTKPQIKTFLETRFGYVLDRPLDDIRPTYAFDVSCAGSVPEALAAFLQSTDFEDALRNAVSLGAMPTRKPASRGPSPKRSIVVCPRRSRRR